MEAVEWTQIKRKVISNKSLSCQGAVPTLLYGFILQLTCFFWSDHLCSPVCYSVHNEFLKFFLEKNGYSQEKFSKTTIQNTGCFVRYVKNWRLIRPTSHDLILTISVPIEIPLKAILYIWNPCWYLIILFLTDGARVAAHFMNLLHANFHFLITANSCFTTRRCAMVQMVTVLFAHYFRRCSKWLPPVSIWAVQRWTWQKQAPLSSGHAKFGDFRGL